MKKIRYIVTIALATFVLQPFTGCKHTVEPQGGSEEFSIEVDGSVNDVMSVQDGKQAASTRLSATAFDDGDTISMYVVKYVNGIVASLGADANTYISNQLFKRSEGLFKSYNGTIFTRQYFPKDGSSVDIYAVHPYNVVTPTDYAAYKFAVKGDQSATSQSDYFKSDFMMAKRVNVAPTAVPNKIVFNHLLSRVVINAKATGFLDGTTISSAKLLGTATEATINLRAYDNANQVAGSVTSVAKPSTITTFTLATPTTDFDKTFVAIVPPQIWVKDAVVAEIILSNKAKQTLKLKEAFTLVSGKEHVLNIDVSFGEQYAITDTVSIRPWGSTDAAAAAAQTSDNRFHVELTNKGSIVVGPTTMIRIGVNGNRTFELPLTKLSGAVVNDLYFEFRGTGNRPNSYPFTINAIELVNAAGVTVVAKVAVNPVIEITKPEVTELVYDMSAKTIIKK